MTSVSQLTSTQPDASTQAQGSSKGTLGKDDFLKLFVAQLQNQDPSSPMDTGAQMAQMAQFSSVEALTNLTTQQTAMAKSMAQSQAVGLIGRTVSWIDTQGNTQSGVVQSVSTSKDGSTTLTTVDGASGIDPSTISTVA
jgi:flagellar basal-body rod modification protein FlgD